MNKFAVFFFLFALSGCSRDKNTAVSHIHRTPAATVVNRFYEEMFNAHNVSKIDIICSPDFLNHNPDPIYSKVGRESFKANFKEFFIAFPDAHISIDMMLSYGDTVVSMTTMTGSNTGNTSGALASGKKFNMQGVDIVVVKNGKAIERWGFFEEKRMMIQLGFLKN